MYYLVAPQASGLGLIAADPISLAVCSGFALVYGLLLAKLVSGLRTAKAVAAGLLFFFGAASMIVLYPAQERYASPSAEVLSGARNYAERCVEGFNPEDRVDVRRRAKSFFDPLTPSQWVISIWFSDRAGSFSFSVYERELDAECRRTLKISPKIMVTR